MSSTTPILDFFLPETHSSKLLAVADTSFYPTGLNISTPTIEITPPGWNKVAISFTPNSAQVYNSTTLGITGADCDTIDLPDGIYPIKYSIAPAYKYSVEKNIFIVSSLYQKWDECWVRAHLFCGLNRTTMQLLDGIECYIQGAIAAANKCSLKVASDLYNQANKLLDNYLNK